MVETVKFFRGIRSIVEFGRAVLRGIISLLARFRIRPKWIWPPFFYLVKLSRDLGFILNPPVRVNTGCAAVYVPAWVVGAAMRQAKKDHLKDLEHDRNKGATIEDRFTFLAFHIATNYETEEEYTADIDAMKTAAAEERFQVTISDFEDTYNRLLAAIPNKETIH